MNTNLKTALAELVESGDRLDEDAQDALARLITASVAEVEAAPRMSTAELAELDRRMREDVQDAPMAEVRAIFERHGIRPRF